MKRRGKKYKGALQKIGPKKALKLEEALQLSKENAYAKFNETLDMAVCLGVDPRKADQNIRGSVTLPHGTGKKVVILVLADGEKIKEAEEAGADFAGGKELIEKIEKGWMEFDRVVATPNMMGAVGKIGKILGPRGLMPNPKTGTVTFEVSKVINEIRAGKVDFRVDKAGIVHAPIGKVSFSLEALVENAKSFLEILMKLKPSSSKGHYMKGLSVSSTMGMGLKIDPALTQKLL
ncbi:MAG: 50S ribosomal protein L1 [Nitrospinae bacterium]|nr:50S ribosomal protein L1 [Nitrospinota bacterium]